MSVEKPDSIVTGMNDVRQCIDTILKTRKGEDPLRPHFGCGLFDWIDKPVNTAAPNMKKEIIEALGRYEPRVRVVSIFHEIVPGGIKFNINYRLPDGDSDFFELTTSGEGVTTGPEVNQLILQAEYDDAIRYYIHLSLDGKNILPPPPSSGFANITDLFAWVTNYWYLYGAWHWLFAQKKIVLYVPTDIAAIGNLSIQSVNNVLTAIIPELTEGGQEYDIVFRDGDGNRAAPVNGPGINTRAGILSFVTANYGGYGTWSIDGNKLVLTGSVILDGFTLQVEITSLASSFSLGFNNGFEA